MRDARSPEELMRRLLPFLVAIVSASCESPTAAQPIPSPEVGTYAVTIDNPELPNGTLEGTVRIVFVEGDTIGTEWDLPGFEGTPRVQRRFATEPSFRIRLRFSGSLMGLFAYIRGGGEGLTFYECGISHITEQGEGPVVRWGECEARRIR